MVGKREKPEEVILELRYRAPPRFAPYTLVYNLAGLKIAHQSLSFWHPF